jgi:hypothetical protein
MENNNLSTIKDLVTIIVLAFGMLGYFIKYRNDLKLQKRKDSLDMINRQLSEFYGPILGQRKIAQKAWDKFVEKYNIKLSDFHEDTLKKANINSDIWQKWIRNVFFPINDNILQTFISKNDLLIKDKIEDKIDDVFIDYCLHSATFRVVMDSWRDNKESDLFSYTTVSFEKFDEAINEGYVSLLKKRKKLLS